MTNTKQIFIAHAMENREHRSEKYELNSSKRFDKDQNNPNNSDLSYSRSEKLFNYEPSIF